EGNHRTSAGDFPVTVGAVEVIGRLRFERAVRLIVGFGADIAADLDTSVSARDVEESRAVQATNLHVLDRSGLYGKIGGLRPGNRNETRCTAEEKASNHLHLEPPNRVLS